MRYRYEYKGEVLSLCPNCCHDLTTDMDMGVLIEMTNGQTNHTVRSRFDSKGYLEDPTREVENGYHSATLCGNCEEMLINSCHVDEIRIN